MASKQHIKETINVLCKVMIHNGGTKITPEAFRLAKFDKNEVTGVMWKMLFETIWYLKFNTFRSNEDFSGDNSQDMILWIKHEVFTRGYYVKELYLLPEDMSCGSREVLLAFGWLMSKSKLIHQLLGNCHNICEECLPINWESLVGPNPSNEKLKKNSKNFSNEEVISNWDQLSWILGNLTFNCKGLFTAENQLASLISKVHSSTQGVETSKGHLSVLEVHLLRHPKELTRFLEKTEQYNTYLENLLKFVDMQDIFWKWLESVCEARIPECGDSERLAWNCKKPCTACCETSDDKLSDVCKVQAEIQKFLNDNEKEEAKVSKEVQLDDMESVCEMKMQEFNKKLESLMSCDRPSIMHTEVQTFPELRHFTASGNVKQSEQSCAQREIDVRKRELSELELKLLELRNEHSDILNDLVGNLEDAVFIPPIEKSRYTELRNK